MARHSNSVRVIFDQELTDLSHDLTLMGRHVEHAIDEASRALFSTEISVAEGVIARDDLVDELDRSLDERCIMLLARQQPVATDLRTVISSLRMSTSFERMGDLARHVAELTRLRYPHRVIDNSLHEVFADMAHAARQVAAKTAELVATRDLTLAAEIERDDDILDLLHRTVFTRLIEFPGELSPQAVIDATLCGRYFERFGDHAVSIARRIVFLVSGEYGASTEED